MKLSLKIMIIMSTLAFLTTLGTVGVVASQNIYQSYPITNLQTKTFTPDELIQFDGTDPSKPIYLAFEGNVYDVTAGREYYRLGGVYHSLAGHDATVDLHIAGGSIIKKKYPIVGILSK